MRDEISEYKILIAALRRKPILLVDRKRAKLVTEGEAIRYLSDRRVIMMNAQHACHLFSKLEGVGRDGECSFSAEQIATIAGTTVDPIEAWEADGTLLPTHGDRYGFCDAYCAGLVGSLQRQHMPTRVLRQIQPLFLGLLTAATVPS